MTAKGRFPGTPGASELQVHTVSTGDVGTDANTTEKVLKSAVFSSGTLDTNGRRIKFKAWGFLANNANNKTVRVRFGPTTLTGAAIITKGPTAFQNRAWQIEGEIVRSSDDNQSTVATWLMTTGAADNNDVSRATLSQSDDQALRLEVTGQNANASANDIVCSGFIAEVVSAP